MKELETENACLKQRHVEEKPKAEILNETITKNGASILQNWDGSTGSIWVPYINQIGLRYLCLRNVKHFQWSHKRFYYITTKGGPFRSPELELNLRIKPRKRLERDKPDALVVRLGINQV